MDQSPRYSARNTTTTLMRFSTVAEWMCCVVSSRVCRKEGKGVAIICSTGTPAGMEGGRGKGNETGKRGVD